MPSLPSKHRPPHTMAPEAAAEEYARWRGSAAERGYDHRWRKLRDRFIAAHPLCLHCEQDGRVTIATMVDHIKEVRLRPDLRLVESNLRSLCDAHHQQRHAGDRKG